MIKFVRAELAWYYKRMRCRLFGQHNTTCHSRPDHLRADGTPIGKHR